MHFTKDNTSSPDNLIGRVRRFSMILTTLLLGIWASNNSFGQIQNYDETPRGSVYFGIGYEMQFYSNSKIHVQQDGLFNNYDLVKAVGLDHGTGLPFSPTQLSYRLGYYFNYSQDEGIELSLDPCRYYLQDNQSVALSGTKNGLPVSGTQLFSKSAGNYYYLGNGLGRIMLNYSGRFGVYRKESYNFAIDVIGKAGLGVVMPDVSNSLDNNKNSPSVQFAGVNFGAEIGVRWISHRHYTLDLTYKYNYAMLNNIKVYEGTASQSISSGAVALHLGVFLPTTKANPLFDKGWAHRKRITHTRPMYLIDSKY